MRLIDADKVKFNFPYGIDHNGILMVPYNSCKCSLDAAPTVDAVPVVRCQECAFSVPLDRNCELSTSIYLHCNEHHGEEIKNVWHKYKKYYKDYSLVSRDDFCSYGKRKEEQG